MMLGTQIESALSVVGITSERVSNWLGRPCRCPERIEQLNRLSCWAARVLRGHTANAVQHLEQLMEEDDAGNPCLSSVR